MGRCLEVSELRKQLLVQELKESSKRREEGLLEDVSRLESQLLDLKEKGAVAAQVGALYLPCPGPQLHGHLIAVLLSQVTA